MTKKEKINWLIKNTTNLTEGQKGYWTNYLNMGLIFSPDFTHKLLDEFISYCKETNGGCFLKQFQESEIHLAV